MVLDAWLALTIFRQRKPFLFTFDFVLCFGYYCVFLCFDSFLLIYYIEQQATSDSMLYINEKYNLISIGLIMTLFVITIFRLLLGTMASIFRSVAKSCSQPIVDEKIQSSLHHIPKEAADHV